MEIVKVKYFIRGDQLGSGEYTYFSEARLNVGDIVEVPVRNTTGRAQVSAINVPDSEIEKFRDKVKTIPAGNTETLEQFTERNDDSPYLPDAHDDAFPEPETAIALRPGEDVEVRDYYEESLRVLHYAEERVIATADDNQKANDDLVLIGKITKAMEDKKKECLEPYKAIQETYKLLMAPIIKAKEITRVKMATFYNEQKRVAYERDEIERKRREAAEAEARLNNQPVPETPVVTTYVPPTKVRTDMGTSGMTDCWKYVVEDFAALPDDFKVEDSAMLNAIAKKHHDTKKVAGVRFYNEPYVATRAK